MPTIASEAVCVRHWDFSETSQTVSLFTRDLGMLRGLGKGARRERGRFSGGIDLLTRGRMIAIVKSGRELATLTDWDLLETFRHLRERLDVNRVAFYLAELASRMIADASPHPRSYDALVSALRSLSKPSAIDETLVRFQWTLLDDCGYRPSLVEPAGAATIAFSPDAGGVVAGGGAHVAWPVRRETIAHLRRIADEAAKSADSPAGDAQDGSFEADPWESVPGEDATHHEESPAARRAARLLAAYARELIGFEPTTMLEVFGHMPGLPRGAR